MKLHIFLIILGLPLNGWIDTINKIELEEEKKIYIYFFFSPFSLPLQVGGS